MKKINCLIAEDELFARELLRGYAEQVDTLNVVGECATGMEVFNALKRHSVDLLFLDIQMPGISGISLLRNLQNPPATVITTASPDFALEGYELNVLDYLLKPFSFGRFLKAVDKYSTLKRNDTTVSTSVLHPLFIDIKTNKKMQRVLLDDILYIEALKDYVRIFTKEEAILTNRTVTYFEEKLPADLFVRVHRSFIVALKQIKSYTTAVIDVGETSIPIGETYSKHFMKKIMPSAN